MNRLLYTIMPDFGGAYAWVKDSTDATAWVGGNCADNFGGLEESWHGEHPISVELAREFAVWQQRFESTVAVGYVAPVGGWSEFHEVGLSMANRLKAELGDAADVRYLRPLEDPDTADRHEFGLGGEAGAHT